MMLNNNKKKNISLLALHLFFVAFIGQKSKTDRHKIRERERERKPIYVYTKKMIATDDEIKIFVKCAVN